MSPHVRGPCQIVAMRQLLPVTNRSHRDSMAAFGTRLCPSYVAITARNPEVADSAS